MGSYKRYKYSRNQNSRLNKHMKNKPNIDTGKLYLSEYLSSILKTMNNPIAKRMITDTQFSSNKFNLNWINITKSVTHLSYTTINKIHKPGDQWEKKNRTPIQIKKLIRRLYGKSFNTKQIKSFVSSYKTAYEKFIKTIQTNNNTHSEQNNSSGKFSYDNRVILNKVLMYTEQSIILWSPPVEYSENFIKYTGVYEISDTKSVELGLYHSDKYSDYITFYLITKKPNVNKRGRNFLLIINDNKSLEIIQISIDDILNFY